MFPYFLGLTIIFPIVLALFFLLNKKNLIQRAAIFLMAAVLFSCSGWALIQGKDAFQAVGDLAGILEIFFGASNVAMIIGMGYWSLRGKNRVQSGLTLAQGILLGCFLWNSGGLGGPGSFVLDHLSGLMLLLVDGVGAVVLLFSIRYMGAHERRHSPKKNRQSIFFASTALLLGSMNGLILSNHLLWMLLFLQVSISCAFLLIAHDRTHTALNNASYFAGVCSVGCVALLAGILLVFSTTGTLLVSELLMFKDTALLLAPLACFVVAGLVFSAQFPFQNALIRSMTSPVPVSALLQTSTIVMAGGYLILRLSPAFINTWLAQIVAVIGAFSFAAGALLAAVQQASRRVLTLTTISSMGLVISLTCFPAVQAIYAAVLLVVLHGLSKALLFLCIGSYSRLRIPLFLTLFGGASMLMPPFGVPVAQWTAIESSVRNPLALGLILAGCVFTMTAWTRFIGERLPVVIAAGIREKANLILYAPQLALAAGVTMMSLFLVPFANYSVAPILKENYGRFGDIAQGEANEFLIREYSGIDPMLVFAALSLIFCLGWFGIRPVAGRAAAEPDAGLNPEEGSGAQNIGEAIPAPTEMIEEETTGEAAEPIACQMEPDNPEAGVVFLRDPDATSEVLEGIPEIAAGTAPVLIFSHGSVFSAFPEAKRIYRYATIIGGALVVIMLEVVFR